MILTVFYYHFSIESIAHCKSPPQSLTIPGRLRKSPAVLNYPLLSPHHHPPSTPLP